MIAARPLPGPGDGILFAYPQEAKQCDVFLGAFQPFPMEAEKLHIPGMAPFTLHELAVEEFSQDSPRSWTLFAVEGGYTPSKGWEHALERVPWPTADEITYNDDVVCLLIIFRDAPQNELIPFAVHHRDNKRPDRSKIPQLVGGAL